MATAPPLSNQPFLVIACGIECVCASFISLTPFPPLVGEDYIDDELARAIGHPTRAQILAEANERVMSPSQFAKRHELDVSQVAYHFRQLEKYECLEIVAEVPVRGSTEHFYKATRRTLFDGKAWDNLPETIKNKISGRTVTDLLEAISRGPESAR